MSLKIRFLFISFLLILLSGCNSASEKLPSSSAKAIVKDGSGKILGEVHFENNLGNVKVSASLKGLPANSKLGFHIHEVGKCEGDFTSAKGHFNPTNLPHSDPGSDGHVGDLGNLSTNKDGTSRYEYNSAQIRLDDHKESVLGKAIIIHRGEDDFVTQPSGDAGERFACGVIKRN